MIDVDLNTLLGWISGTLWALARIGGVFLMAPVFGATVIPARIRAATIVLLAVVLAPLAPNQLDAFSASGIATIVSQLLIGCGVGFVLRLIFEAVAFGGQLVGQSMSLGFAELVNPTAGGSVPVLSQFYQILVTLLFLAMDGHLLLISLLADSFHSLPPGTDALSSQGLWAVASFGGELFSGAVRVALPAVTALLLVNIGFAAISRAAPSMNLFAVGFPITLCLGFVAVWLALRGLSGAYASLQSIAWNLMRKLVGN